VDLLRRVVDLPGRFRVRLSSLESREITPELIELMAGSRGRICPHLHVSVQSGSNRVLRRMHRRDTAEEIIERCRAVQKALDAPGLTADVIVGFPGESEADFEASCSLVRDVGFSKVHVFRFSPREGTAAAAMSDQLDGRVKHDRASRLIALADGLRQRYLQSLCGRRLEVLVERTLEGEPKRLRGTSARYAPVELPAQTADGSALSGDDPLLGKLVEAEAVAVCRGRLQC
jgi:threonylcarbamoyladenosine tRNA methylthiotransferase MtaB